MSSSERTKLILLTFPAPSTAAHVSQYSASASLALNSDPHSP